MLKLPFKLPTITHEVNKEQPLTTAAEISNFLFPIATDLLAEEKKVDPLLLVVSTDKIDFVSIGSFFRDKSTKQLLRPFMDEVCSISTVLGIGLVVEAWSVTINDLKNSAGNVEQGESLIVYAEWNDCTRVNRIVPFSRTDNGITIHDELERERVEVGGTFTGFFTPSNRGVIIH